MKRFLYLFFGVAVAFFGGVMGIINFHSDVDMSGSHRTLYRSITGRESDRPLAISIPYTIGLGVGIALLLPGSGKDENDDA